VLRLVTRQEPLRIIRCDRQPFDLTEDSFILRVYPQQKRAWDPLYYYFELEQHFLDIMQCRALDVEARLDLIGRTIRTVSRSAGEDDLPRALNQIVNGNYDYLENRAAGDTAPELCPADILLEHFFVNFIFKKPFYLFGLQHTERLLKKFWQTVATRRRIAPTPQDDLASTGQAICEIELHYGHDRRKLLSR
jgi:lysine-N-methylase